MTRSFTKICALSGALIGLSAGAVAAGSGYMQQVLQAEHRSQDLDLHIWYPTSETEGVQHIGKNAVFKGVTTIPDATPQDGAFPAIVLSHGSGGNAVNIAWLATAIAQEGYIVLAVNHPNSTSGNSIPAETVKIWERPMDMKVVLDHVQNNGLGALNVDMSRIGAIGFSLGGHTALALAGAQVNQNMYIEYCNDNFGKFDCKWFQDAGVDLTKIDKIRYEQNNRDPRITVSIAIDPAVAPAYTQSSLERVDIPVQIINLGAKEDIPTAVRSEHIVASLSDGELHYVQDAWHYSFIGECTRLGRHIIAASGEGEICEEKSDVARSELQQNMFQLINGFLSENL